MAASPGPRRSLFFVHGYSCSWRHWAEARERLGRRHDVALVSLPGHGGTPLPPGGSLRFDDCVQHILAQVSESGQPGVILVGHSLGGMLGVAGVHRRPDLFRALVLVDAYPTLGQPSPFDRSFWEGSPPALKASIVRGMMEARRGLPATLWESVAAFDGRLLLAEVGLPVRGIYGDRGQPDHAAHRKHLLDNGLAGARDVGIHFVRNAAHFVMLEQPEEFWEVLAEVVAGQD
jgi:pimeloyl-ACP methyl ester carboxylesterase